MPNPKLPPILINKAGSVYYVYTYKNIWDRELKRSKRGESKKIGTILGGQKEGKIRFDEAFLQEHPEFRNYQVERKGKDYVFTLGWIFRKSDLISVWRNSGMICETV